MERDFEQEGLRFEVRGLDALKPLANNPHAARKRGLSSMRRVTVTASGALENELIAQFAACGASGYTSIPCRGAGRRDLETGSPAKQDQVRVELVVTIAVCHKMLDMLRRDFIDQHSVTVCVESVDVLRAGAFSLEATAASHETVGG